ncbi:hypothetical protein FRZ67_15155 [Panacibacter ginsenosidivorans]|uniref:Uncharacterized protein n=1 Tax=Panacibacter ginsenosidivorans TaxID=1813871 RepID=A0A5B8VBD1_9BACT|nr:hypothetical protein [Panacibacter ginsenosidivorans]QEC68579.1 hypothetical protein FRZ67_15155 [Panacibacter ginsenosidivorans]
MQSDATAGRYNSLHNSGTAELTDITLLSDYFPKPFISLPPFGILGIPFTVVGTQEDPQVKLRCEKDSDKLEETQEKADPDEPQ